MRRPAMTKDTLDADEDKEDEQMVLLDSTHKVPADREPVLDFMRVKKEEESEHEETTRRSRFGKFRDHTHPQGASRRVSPQALVERKLGYKMTDEITSNSQPDIVETQDSETIEETQDQVVVVDADTAHSGSIPSLPTPFSPLSDTYSYHSPTPSADGPYMLGVDEAGRGPALGPMVYGVAYCPIAYKTQLEELGFADSKVLTHETRSGLLEILGSDPENLAWSVRVISPQAISNGMLRRPPTNLNKQSENATVTLIQEVLVRGIRLTEVFVDALGNTTSYEKRLSNLFPGISFTVTTKADSKFKIVGAASIAAKVTRDAWVTGWAFEEHESSPQYVWPDARGSGYPSDPKTQAWLKDSIEPTFGYPSLVRFSWATVKVALDKNAHAVKWTDEGNTSLVKAFEGSRGLDKGRCILARELSIKSVADL